ncbi:DUF2818 family protein [Thiobacillus sp.]|uniref:DUF2818 family protein n=1 Tax=Thiobacillus sp. TaxID=924 RepID=UPI00286E54F1|nr:DUF2818 family protein [Thiobacillus sp.]
MNFSTTLLLILAFIAANLPFLVERIFFFVSPRKVNFSIVWMLFSFKGRLPRTPYWLVTPIVLAKLVALGLVLFDAIEAQKIAFSIFVGLVFILYAWVFFAVQVKRLHDQDISGKWSLLYFVPGVAVLSALNGLVAGADTENRFGAAEPELSQPPEKRFFWRLVELALLHALVLTLATLLEANLGEVHKQNWEFYAVNASLFVVFAYPGFVYRYLWRRRGG